MTAYPSILYTNSRSIVNKIDELRLLIASHNSLIEIISISESWLHYDIPDCCITIPTYNVIRSDRQNRIGGGVCVWLKDSINFLQYTPHNPIPTEIEFIFLVLFKFKIIFCLLYIPPQLTASNYLSIQQFIISNVDDLLIQWPAFKSIIIGDFNKMCTSDLESHCDVTPIVTENTRGNNILDQIFINTNDSHVYKIIICSPIGDSDHNCITLVDSRSDNKTNVKTTHKVYDFRKSNIDGFLKKLENFNFVNLLKNNDINEQIEILQQACNLALESIPHRIVTMNSQDKPWMTPKLKLLINDRWLAYKRRDFGKYTHLKNKIKTEIVSAKKSWINKNSNNTKKFWNMINNIIGRSNTISTFTSLRTSLNINNDYELANSINNMFKDSFIKSDIQMNIIPRDNEESIIITEEEVFLELAQLKTRKAYPKSDLHPRLYLEAILPLTPILCNIFNHSLTSHTVPENWKNVEVIPLPKCNHPNINQLRPISLLYTPIKIMEKILLKKLKSMFNNIIDRNQYGFKPKSSTTCALLDIQEFITSQLDKHSTSAVALITIDFSKAFDRIDHALLITKLSKITGPTNKK